MLSLFSTFLANRLGYTPWNLKHFQEFSFDIPLYSMTQHLLFYSNKETRSVRHKREIPREDSCKLSHLVLFFSQCNLSLQTISLSRIQTVFHKHVIFLRFVLSYSSDVCSCSLLKIMETMAGKKHEGHLDHRNVINLECY